jgi:hypothetical protein
MPKLLTILLLPALLAAVLAAQEAEEEGPDPTLADLEWMVGSWQQRQAGAVTEELWMAPRGKLMLGLNRSTRGDGRAQFEYLRIEETDAGIVYWASPGGQAATPFRLVEVEEGLAVFTNPAHDFPQRIEYRLEGDRLVAAISADRPGPKWSFELAHELGEP